MTEKVSWTYKFIGPHRTVIGDWWTPGEVRTVDQPIDHPLFVEVKSDGKAMPKAKEVTHGE